MTPENILNTPVVKSTLWVFGAMDELMNRGIIYEESSNKGQLTNLGISMWDQLDAVYKPENEEIVSIVTWMYNNGEIGKEDVIPISKLLIAFKDREKFDEGLEKFKERMK